VKLYRAIDFADSAAISDASGKEYMRIY